MARLSQYKTYTVVLLVMLFVIFGGFLLSRLSQKSKQSTVVKAELIKTGLTNDVVEVSDGYEEMRLILRTVPRADGSVANFLYTADASGNEKLIFEKVMPEGQGIAVPVNSWSPDRSYVFVVEHGETDNVLVFNASGEPLGENEKYINVSRQFKADVPDYRMKAATGWAAGNLLIIKTETSSGERGISYWFEVPTNSFMQLVD